MARTQASIVLLEKFIQATRESGYRTTTSAIAELVDNAVQAAATEVRIHIERNGEADNSLRVAVIDNGSGMTPTTLREALRFGGSSRFNDRGGLGRFGMGLPNASLSQARRVDVFTWRSARTPIWSFLDVDEIIRGNIKHIPEPERASPPQWVAKPRTRSGTIVVWDRCDRLDHRRASTVERKLRALLGRMFRYFLWDGVKITINGEEVRSIDPLFLSSESAVSGATAFQDAWECEVRASSNGASVEMGVARVRFSELPVYKWQHLSNEEKRRLGVTNGAGFSIVRAGREVDYGWFFTGAKRRENYDDWWRAEIQFEPALDEAFGITHTKQQIQPQPHLIESLQPHIEPIARVLNSRVRRAHRLVHNSQFSRPIEQIAQRRERELQPLPPRRPTPLDQYVSGILERNPDIAQLVHERSEEGPVYRLLEEDLSDPGFYRPVVTAGLIAANLNHRHPIYDRLFRPLIEKDSPDMRDALYALLLSAARAEGMASKVADRRALEEFRRRWSRTLEVFLR